MLNGVCYEGRLTKDAEFKVIDPKKGTNVTKFTLAVDRDYKGDDGKRPTDFFPVEAWNLPDWIISKYLKKGMTVIVNGRNQSRRWTDSEEKEHFVIELKADNVYPVEIPKKED